MFTDNFVLGPICCRLFVKAVLASHRNSEFLAFTRSKRTGTDSNSLMDLTISSVDAAGYTVLSFEFRNDFFISVEASELSSAGLSTPTLVNTKQVVRMFRGVSPNRIASAHLRINVESVQIDFYWKTGLISTRTISAVVPTEGSHSPPSVFPTGPPRIKLGSFAPKFLHGLLTLIPESAALWTLTVCHRKTDRNQSQLVLTNSQTGEVSIVEMALSQGELNRNGSYFSHSECTLLIA